MNEKLLTSLLGILQKQANSIRTLKIMNIALADMIRKVAERSGWEYEEVEKLVQESFSDAAASEPHHHRQDIAKQIEETIDELSILEEQMRKPSN
jgi:tryptophan 2,3-dioxygenase